MATRPVTAFIQGKLINNLRLTVERSGELTDLVISNISSLNTGGVFYLEDNGPSRGFFAIRSSSSFELQL